MKHKYRLGTLLLSGLMVLTLVSCTPSNPDEGRGVKGPEITTNPTPDVDNPNSTIDPDTTPNSEGDGDNGDDAGDSKGGSTYLAEHGAEVYNSDKIELYINNLTRGTDFRIIDVANDSNNGYIVFYCNNKTGGDTNITMTELIVNDKEATISSTSSVGSGEGYTQFYWFVDQDNINEVDITSLKINLVIDNSDGTTETTGLIELVGLVPNIEYIEVAPREIPDETPKDSNNTNSGGTSTDGTSTDGTSTDGTSTDGTSTDGTVTGQLGKDGILDTSGEPNQNN